MATERVVTKVKYRLKNGTSTVLPLGTTSDYVQINDGSGETLTQRLEAIDRTIRPRQLDILKVQAHLNDGTIEKYCKIVDYVELDPAGKGPTRFYVIGINGHNGQPQSSIHKDHIDFYGGSTAAFESFLPSANYTQGDAAQSAAWRTTTFFNDYINNSSYSDGTEIRRDFFNLDENYDSLNFAKKVVSDRIRKSIDSYRRRNEYADDIIDEITANYPETRRDSIELWWHIFGRRERDTKRGTKYVEGEEFTSVTR